MLDSLKEAVLTLLFFFLFAPSTVALFLLNHRRRPLSQRGACGALFFDLLCCLLFLRHVVAEVSRVAFVPTKAMQLTRIYLLLFFAIFPFYCFCCISSFSINNILLASIVTIPFTAAAVVVGRGSKSYARPEEIRHGLTFLLEAAQLRLTHPREIDTAFGV